MASPKQRETFDKRVNTSAGHYVKWTITAEDLHVMLTWDFEKNYRTLCNVAPSVWDFKMSFSEVKADGSSSLSVALTRKDKLDVGMGASLWVEVEDPQGAKIYPKKIFTQFGMLHESAIRESFELLPNSNMGDAVNRKSIILVTIMICSCHFEGKTSGDGDH